MSGPPSTDRISLWSHSASAATSTLAMAAEGSGWFRVGTIRTPLAAMAAVGRLTRQEGHVLDIQLDQADGYTVCRPVGELDAFTVSQFRQALAELASNPRLLIDMSGVPFVDS